MALILNFNLCESGGCNSLTFSELTGLYNAESNTTGYGTPNPDIGDATAAVLTVTLASGDSYDIDLFETGNFPTTNSSIEYEINPTEIGYASLDDLIDDQIITFTYTVTIDDEEYTQVVVKALYCQVQCCVNTMFVELDFTCDCSVDETNKALKAFAMLQGLKQAAGCGNVTNFNNILTQLNKLCATTSCASCN